MERKAKTLALLKQVLDSLSLKYENDVDVQGFSEYLILNNYGLRTHFISMMQLKLAIHMNELVEEIYGDLIEKAISDETKLQNT